MDGFGFIQAFQRLNITNKDRVLLAILTSSVSEWDRERARALGIKHFLTKPVSEIALKAILTEAGIL
jgi:CheY-like chemotaxis protein